MLWLYKFYFCHWTVVVKESFFNPLSLIQLVFRRLVTAFLTNTFIWFVFIQCYGAEDDRTFGILGEVHV